MRVFGGGFSESTAGKKYPSLKVCDEIKGETNIVVKKKEGNSRELW
jgi:hypothetical protein